MDRRAEQELRKEREWRLFMTGVIVGALLSILAKLIPLPWWLGVPLSLAGLWVIFDVGRAWERERRRNRR